MIVRVSAEFKTLIFRSPRPTVSPRVRRRSGILLNGCLRALNDNSHRGRTPSNSIILIRSVLRVAVRIRIVIRIRRKIRVVLVLVAEIPCVVTFLLRHINIYLRRSHLTLHSLLLEPFPFQPIRPEAGRQSFARLGIRSLPFGNIGWGQTLPGIVCPEASLAGLPFLSEFLQISIGHSFSLRQRKARTKG